MRRLGERVDEEVEGPSGHVLKLTSELDGGESLTPWIGDAALKLLADGRTRRRVLAAVASATACRDVVRFKACVDSGGPDGAPIEPLKLVDEPPGDS